MYSSNGCDQSLKVRTLFMPTIFSQNPSAASFYLNDVSNKLSFSFFWCAVFCRLSARALFEISLSKKFPSKLIRWKVVWGKASINIICAEIKALFLWWKCMLRCSANFHLFHSRRCQLPLSGLCWCGKFECLDVIKKVWRKIHCC